MYKRHDENVRLVDLGVSKVQVTTDGTQYTDADAPIPYLPAACLGADDKAYTWIDYQPTSDTSLATGQRLAFAVALRAPSAVGITEGNVRVEVCADWTNDHEGNQQGIKSIIIGQPAEAIAAGWNANNTLSNWNRVVQGTNLYQQICPVQFLLCDLQNGGIQDYDEEIIVGIEMCDMQGTNALNVDYSQIYIAARYVLEDVKENVTGGTL